MVAQGVGVIVWTYTECQLMQNPAGIVPEIATAARGPHMHAAGRWLAQHPPSPSGKPWRNPARWRTDHQAARPDDRGAKSRQRAARNRQGDDEASHEGPPPPASPRRPLRRPPQLPPPPHRPTLSAWRTRSHLYPTSPLAFTGLRSRRRRWGNSSVRVGSTYGLSSTRLASPLLSAYASEVERSPQVRLLALTPLSLLRVLTHGMCLGSPLLHLPLPRRACASRAV